MAGGGPGSALSRWHRLWASVSLLTTGPAVGPPRPFLPRALCLSHADEWGWLPLLHKRGCTWRREEAKLGFQTNSKEDSAMASVYGFKFATDMAGRVFHPEEGGRRSAVALLTDAPASCHLAVTASWVRRAYHSPCAGMDTRDEWGEITPDKSEWQPLVVAR